MLPSVNAPLDLLLVGARVVTCDGPATAPPSERLGILPEGACVGVRDGRIAYLGPRERAPETSRVVDAEGGALLPGLVDPHTHLVFAGSRIDEFARRMAGEDYRAIAASGGGIAATVTASRRASDPTLWEGARARAVALRRTGVTSLEVKSGYGLRLPEELRALRIGRRLDEEGVVRTTTSFLGAHALPPEHRADRAGYVRLLVEQMLPAVAESGLADACDVYCDEGAFTLAEARRILEAARAHGLRVRGHVGQFADLGGAELLAELGALSADHLERVSERGARALAEAGVVAVLLPGAWCTLRDTPPDVELLRRSGVRLAVGTDANPGTSPMLSLPLAAALAVREAGLTLEEALLGVTRHAAEAAGLRRAGRIRLGWPADLLLCAEDDPRVLAYALGGWTPTRAWIGGREIPPDPSGRIW